MLLCLVLTGCAWRDAVDAAAPLSRTVFAMDTVMNLTVYGKNGAAALDAAEPTLISMDSSETITLTFPLSEAQISAYNAAGAVTWTLPSAGEVTVYPLPLRSTRR